MATESARPPPDRQARALASLRASLPEPEDEELVELRPEGTAFEELRRPLHNPWWAGGEGG